MGLGDAFGLVAPYYNLAFVIIVVILFITLLKIKNKQVYTKPWLLLFIAVCIFIVEEIMTVLRGLDMISFPSFIFGVFEMVMISLFIYTVLLQKQFVKIGKRE